jgi:prevent-host-death family protein
MSELMSATYNICDAKAKLSELAARAASGEEIVIARNGRPLARIVALERVQQPQRIAPRRARVWSSEDLDYPLPSEIDAYSKSDGD